MPRIVPPSKPRMSYAEVAAKVDALGLDREAYPFFIVGIRGYYRDSMGAPGANDRGIYDDAIFLVSPFAFSTFNANTDPSATRQGVARLQPGVWIVYRFDKHRPAHGTPYEAICQRGGDVEVVRDGSPDRLDRGRFGINIHRGGYARTSSLGCQTIYP